MGKNGLRKSWQVTCRKKHESTFFLLRKKGGMNQPNAFLGVRPQDVANEGDHTKGAIILKRAI